MLEFHPANLTESQFSLTSRLKTLISGMFSRSFSCLCLFFTSTVACAQAGLIVYTTEGGFTTAAQAVGTQDFTENLDSGSKSGSTITLTDVTISGNNIAAFPNTNSTNTVDGTGYLRFLVSPSTPLTFTFNSAVIAFGFETNPRSQGVSDTFTVDADGTSSSFSMPSTDVTEFRGFVRDTPFTSFTLSDSGSADDFYGIDNLVAYTAVPEPSASAAILLVAFVLYSRQRSRS
jgi:hypothetical protein